MSVRAYNTTTNRGITKTAPTPGSKTQKRKRSGQITGNRKVKGGGLNTHWCGFAKVSAERGQPGAAKR